jgi:hypothetical protein
VSDAHVTYVPRPDSTPEGEAAALAAVYRFILECANREAVGPNLPKKTRPEGGRRAEQSEALNEEEFEEFTF